MRRTLCGLSLIVLIALASGCEPGTATANHVDSPFARLFAHDRFGCTIRSSDGTNTSSGFDRTEFGCAFDAQPWVLYANSLSGRQWFWVSPHVRDRQDLIRALGKTLLWPRKLVDAIAESDQNGSAGEDNWSFGADGWFTISIANPERVT